VQSQFPNHLARLDSPRSSGLQLWRQLVDPRTSRLESLPHPAQYRQSTQHIQQRLVSSTHGTEEADMYHPTTVCTAHLNKDMDRHSLQH
jgi:hypothetical protein